MPEISNNRNGMLSQVFPRDERKADSISREARISLLGHAGAVIWLTGLSASGKSTLAFALETKLFQTKVLSAVLDGDGLRTGLNCDLSFSVANRKESMRRAGHAALLLAETGIVAIVALISPYREDRNRIATLCSNREIAFAEVFVNAPLAVCERRDPKQLYAQAKAGKISDFTGLDAVYEKPISPALELNTDRESVDQSVQKLVTLALRLIQKVNA